MSYFSGKPPAHQPRRCGNLNNGTEGVTPMRVDEEPDVIFLGANKTPTPGSKSRRRGPRKTQKQRAAASTTTSQSQSDEFESNDDEVEELQQVYPPTAAVKMEDETVTLSDSENDYEDMSDGELTSTTSAFNSTDSEGQNHQYYRKSRSTKLHQPHDESDDPMIIEDEEEVKDVTPPEVLQANQEQISSERKRLGNEFFLRGEYHKALEMYSLAIDALPTEPAFYGNRSACYMMLKKYKNAQGDARQAIQMDPTFEKGYLRLLRAALALGDVVATEGALQTIKSLPGIAMNTLDEETKLITLKSLLKDSAAAREKKDFRRLLFLSERAMTIAEGDVNLKMAKADALIKLHRFNDALDICTQVLQMDSMCVEAYYIRSICLFEVDNVDKSMQFLRQALQLAPDSVNCLTLFRKLKKLKEIREEASGCFSTGRFRDAKAKYEQTLELLKSFDVPNATIESKMLMNLSLISLKLGEADEALALVNKAIDLNSSYLKAILHRAQVHNTKEMFDEAVRDYETAQKLDSKNAIYRTYINEAKLAAKRAKRKDYYKILGVDKHASGDDVKKAYKKRALVHHPDRHASATESTRKDQERQFKEIGEAYEVLSDPKKRNRYDAGHDLIDDSPSSSAYGYEQFDSSNLFNVFFGAGGMGGCPNSRASSGPGYPHFKTHHGNYHPY